MKKVLHSNRYIVRRKSRTPHSISSFVHTPETILDIVKKYNIRRCSDLRKKMIEYKDANVPSYNLCIQKFGSWKRLQEAAFGVGQPKVEAPRDKEYLVKVAIMFDIRTATAWNKLHKEKPSIVPPSYCIVKEFLNYSSFFLTLRLRDINRSMSACVDFYRRNGRIPTTAECNTLAIDLQRILSIFGTRKMLKWAVESLVKIEKEKKANAAK